MHRSIWRSVYCYTLILRWKKELPEKTRVLTTIWIKLYRYLNLIWIFTVFQGLVYGFFKDYVIFLDMIPLKWECHWHSVVQRLMNEEANFQRCHKQQKFRMWRLIKIYLHHSMHVRVHLKKAEKLFILVDVSKKYLCYNLLFRKISKLMLISVGCFKYFI
jgi:hypothetical protein